MVRYNKSVVKEAGGMDEQSSKITIKVNGEEKKYEEKPSLTLVEKPNVIDLQEYRNEVKESKKRIVPKVAIAVLLAVGVGSGFGLGLVTMVTKDDTPVTKTNLVSDTPVTTTQASLAPLKVYVLQGGVYTTKQAGIVDQQKLQQKEIPTVLLQQGGKWYLLVGVFESEAQSKALAQQLTQQNISTYGKTFTITEAKGTVQQRSFLEQALKGQGDKATLPKGDFGIIAKTYLQAIGEKDATKAQGLLLKLIGLYMGN